MARGAAVNAAGSYLDKGFREDLKYKKLSDKTREAKGYAIKAGAQ